MADFITIVYLAYSFIAFYFLFLLVIIYAKKRGEMFLYPTPKKEPLLSIVIPCYNEEKTIEGTVKAVLGSDYKNLEMVYIVDDRSTDRSYEIIKELAKRYEKVTALQTKKNIGKASGPKNYGASFVKTELVGFVDADSYPQKDAIRKMIGFFNDEHVAAVTSSIFVKNRRKILEILQDIEYKIIAFTRKLLGFIDSIYVTPGPLAIYRKKIFDKVGGFDETNITEDIEITWNFLSKGYKVEMCIPSLVYTIAPTKLRDWYRQRIRWNVGGLQTIVKYKKEFLKRGMLGTFVLPFFLLSWALGIVGLFIFFYRAFRTLVVNYLAATYSVQTQAAILSLKDINLTPNVLVFFGVMLFVMSISFTLIALSLLKEKEFKRAGIFHILAYSIVYLLAYPFLLVTSIYKFIMGKKTW